MSDLHEAHVAEWLGGFVVLGSGCTFLHKGDVNADTHLVECKRKGAPGKPICSTTVKQMAKITDQAWAHGKIPILAQRFYCPSSLLADNEGWVDLFTTRMVDWPLR